MSMIEMAGSIEKLDEFLYRLQEWRWPEALSGLLSDVMLVTDEDIGAALQEMYGPFNCHISTPAEYADDMQADVRKLIFLCRSDERRHVREAKIAHPDSEVFSATYDLAGVSVSGGGYFEWQQDGTDIEKKDPILIIAPPGSDTEYFSEILSRNGICDAREYLNRTTSVWAAEQSDFSILRFLKGVERKHGSRQLQMILYTDVLQDLLSITGFSMAQFAKLLKQARVQALYFVRRDKSTQTSLLAQLDNELGRSFWAKDHLAQPEILDPVPSIENLDNHLGRLLRMEAAIEPVLAKLQKFKYLTLEETVESPAEVMEAVAVYLGCSFEGEPVWPNYARPYKKRPNLLKCAADYRQTLIDRLGLRVNEHGSYVSDAELLTQQ